MAEQDRTVAPPSAGRTAASPPPSSEGGSTRGFGRSDEPTRVSDSTLHPEPRILVEIEKPTIEGYELLNEIHRGGQGIVYRAMQLGTKRQVALKVLLEGPFASETARRRFEREVELAASLRHPSIVTILDSGVSRGRTYFAMEFIEGQRLDAYLKARQPGLRETLGIFEQICEAVSFAHLRGVIHRDLKPSNILIDAEGCPHVLDFGLAKLERASDPRETTVAVLSTTGQVVGTLAYMSPEQAAGADLVDVRSDVYSLGVVFYEALLGRTPYDVSGPLGEILQRIANDDPARPRNVRGTSRFGRMIDDELETILLKTLEKDPARRYQTAGDLGRDLRHYLSGEPIEAKRASGLYMLKKTIRRYRVQAAAAGLMLAMLFGFLIVFAVLYRSESRLREKADELQTLANRRALAAAEAAQSAERSQAKEAVARRDAERNERRALLSAEDLRRSMVRQKVQAGDLARLRGDLSAARDEYWDALSESPESAAALWKLREYYLSSGDLGSTVISARSHGPTRLAASGLLAAVCDSPRGITVRSTADGAARAWLATPGPVTALSLDDDGGVTAAGAGWVWRWPAGSATPSVTVQLLANDLVLGCHATADGGLVVVTPRDVRRWGSKGEPRGRTGLSARATGSSANQSDGALLAVVTDAGVELIDLTVDTLSASPARELPPGERVRAVKFAARGVLAALTQRNVVLIAVDGSASEPLTYATTAGEWVDFAIHRDADMLALTSADGRVALYSCGEAREAWQVSLEGLSGLALSSDGSRVLTVDGGGVLTQWSTDRRGTTREVVTPKPAIHWTVSDDLSTQAMLDEDGRIFLRAGDDARAAEPVGLPNPVQSLISRRPQACELALSADGTTLAVRFENRVWIPRMTGLASGTLSIRWASSSTPNLREVALSPDGKTIAMRGRGEGTGQELIRVQSLETGRPRPRGVDTARHFEFTGSPVRFMRFVPEGGGLLVGRENGELHLLHSDAPSEADPARPGSPPHSTSVRSGDAWETLESPAYRVTMDRSGLRLAAACDDGVVRIISMLDTGEMGRFPIGRDVSSLSINGKSDALLVRTVDGAIRVFDVLTQESIMEWKPAGEAPRGLASWAGVDGQIIFNSANGVELHRPQAADERIRENMGYPRQKRLARRLADGDFAGAWAVAAELHDIREPLSHIGQAAIVEAFLRRTRGQPPDEWIASTIEGAQWPTLLRLGMAAAEGGRYAVARELLTLTLDSTGGRLDPLSLRALAECHYLLDDPERALGPLGAVLKSGAFDELELSRTHIEYIAALVGAGRRDDARACLRELESLRKTIWKQFGAGLTSAAIAGILVEGEGRVAGGVQAISSLLPEQSRVYQDDLEFFAGEAARRRGDLAAARARYQACVDQARDAWPADWARFRLERLSTQTATQPTRE